MSTRRNTRNALILIKKEVTEGTDSVPTAGANAFKVRSLSISPIEGQEVDLDYIQGYFGGKESIRVSSYATCEFELDFAGISGAGGTAAPWEDALLACAFQQKALMTAVTATLAQVGGSTTTIKLAAGASAVDDYYNGMWLTIGAGTNNGYAGMIIDYVASTKIATLHKAAGSSFDATSSYNIAAATVYEPVTNTLPSVSIYYFLDGVRHIMLGCRGNVSFDLSANGIPTMKFSFTGIDGTITDQAMPTPTLSAFVSPSPLLSANVTGLLGGKEMTGGTTGIQTEKYTLDMQNEVSFRQVLGASGVILTGRNPTGAATIEATSQTFNDWFAYIKALTKAPSFVRNGNGAGNYCTLFMPRAQLTGGKYSDASGIVTQDFGIKAIPVSGNDEVRITIQ